MYDTVLSFSFSMSIFFASVFVLLKINQLLEMYMYCRGTSIEKYNEDKINTSTLFNKGDITTEKPVALGFQIELEFRNVSFCEGRKTGVHGEKPVEQG